MTQRPPPDPRRLSASQIAELALCEARMLKRWTLGKPGSPPPSPTTGSAQDQARTTGIAEHAQFHEQVSRFHNQPVPAAQRIAPPTVESGSDLDPRTVVTPGRGAGSSYCFIATELYGTNHPRTWQLRRFRERCLHPCAPGRWLVARYYRIAPAIAHWLSQHRRWQAPARMALAGLCLVISPWTKEDAHEEQHQHPYQ